MDNKKITYPEARKQQVSDNYFGTEVADPYRWLEDDNSQETARWVEAENALTASVLDAIPFRQAMKERLEALWDYPVSGSPFKKGNYWYFYKNDGKQNQSILYQMDSLQGTPRIFIDPNTFSADGTVALSDVSFNKTGRYCAYSVSKGGSDWHEIFVMDVEKHRVMSDHLRWVKFSDMAWLGDGFFYSRYPEPDSTEALKVKNTHQKIYFHQAGHPQTDDRLVWYDEQHPEQMHWFDVSRDERFIIHSIESPEFRGNSLFYKKAGDKNFKPIESSFQYQTQVVGNIGDTLYIRTNKDAPNYRIVGLRASDPSSTFFEVIPQSRDVLQGCSVFGPYLIAYYLHDAASQAFVYQADGRLKSKVKFPAIGSVSGFTGDEESMTLFYRFSSFTIPGLTYRYDIERNESVLYRKSEFNAPLDDYVTKQVFYTSKDGTRIPMFIVHKKGLKRTGKNPTMLYGYGGFNISLTPSFSEDRLLWLEQGGVYAMPNLRGGGEYGESWHEAGTKLHKQNVFDDFIAAANYLIDSGYTSPAYLAISGRSNGGLLVGAVMTQRPDLMRVAFPGVGVLDMLRYHKFTIGYFWADDYGTSDDSIQFSNLIKYSPYHNIKAGNCYPSTLIVTADHDDRVFPAHSFKFAARLQAAQGCNNPVLIRVDKNAGHGAGKPKDMIIQDKVDQWSFAFYEMGYPVSYPPAKEPGSKP